MRRREGRPAPPGPASQLRATSQDRHYLGICCRVKASRTGVVQPAGLSAQAGWRSGLPAVRQHALRGRGPHLPAGPGGQDVSGAHQPPPTKPAPATPRDPRERSLAAQGERSEKPVAGTDAVAQADLPGPPRRPHPRAVTGTNSADRPIPSLVGRRLWTLRRPT
jgi:hypothetical protein